MLVGINAQKALERETGVGNYTDNLVRALVRLPEARESLRLYLLAGRDELAGRVDGVTVVGGESHWRGSAVRILWEQFGLPRRAVRDGLDLLHYVDHALPVFASAIPAIITVHDLAFYRLPAMYNASRRYYKQFIGRRSVLRAAYVIVNSEATRQEVLALTGIAPEKVTVIHYGLNNAFAPLGAEQAAAARKRFDLTKPFFLFVGTLQPRKNLRNLIAAYARLVRSRDLPHELALAGGHGWLSGDLTAYAGSLGVADRLRFLGVVSQDRLPALYNAATALVYPSWYEGFGLPPLEAMACGVPVIGANATSIPEVVGEAGLLVDPGDIDGLTAAMGRVVDEKPLRERLREAGLRRAHDFSWDRCARETFAVYRKVAENGGRRP